MIHRDEYAKFMMEQFETIAPDGDIPADFEEQIRKSRARLEAAGMVAGGRLTEKGRMTFEAAVKARRQ